MNRLCRPFTFLATGTNLVLAMESLPTLISRTNSRYAFGSVIVFSLSTYSYIPKIGSQIQATHCDVVLNNKTDAKRSVGGVHIMNNYALLYYSGNAVGFVDGGATIFQDKTHVIFGKVGYYPGFPWGKTIKLKARSGTVWISCPKPQLCSKGGLCYNGHHPLFEPFMNVSGPVTCELK